MTYEVLLVLSAQRELKKLPRSIEQSAVNVMSALGDDPRPAGVKKLRGEKDTWRVRVGKDYRVIYEVDDATKKVYVMHVRHRREAY